MAHTVEKRWATRRSPDGSQLIPGVNDAVGTAAANAMRALSEGEELFAQLIEMVAFAGGSMQAVADQLFKEAWEARGETAANAQELAMVQDAAAAANSLHDLYVALTNGEVVASDRASALRRMI